MKKAKVVFMGTPQFAVPVLESLTKVVDVVLVVTQPDKKVGRKQVLTSSAVKKYALQAHIPVHQPEKIKEDFEPILRVQPDLIITCAYGQIISQDILKIPPLGCINVHASLLPKYRGGAPIHKALINGEKETGVTIMYMDQKMDTGDIISQAKYSIQESDNVGTLHDALSHLGADLLLKTLPSILNQTNQRIPQKEEDATYAYTIKREEERLDFHKTGKEIINQIRGLNPWPMANMLVNQEEYKVLEAYFLFKEHSIPGKVSEIKKDAIGIDAIDGTIYITKLKPYGKRMMDTKDFLNGVAKEVVASWKINES